MLDEPVRCLTAGSEPPVAGQQALAIDDDLEWHRGEWHDCQEQPGETDRDTPSLVHPHEDRGRAIGQEDESVDASGDRDEVATSNARKTSAVMRPAQVNISATAKLRKSARGLTILDFSLVVMTDEPLTVLMS